MGAEAAPLCAAPVFPVCQRSTVLYRARILRDCARVLIERHGSKSIIGNSSGIIVWFDAFAALTFTLSVQRMK